MASVQAFAPPYRIICAKYSFMTSAPESADDCRQARQLPEYRHGRGGRHAAENEIATMNCGSGQSRIV